MVRAPSAPLGLSKSEADSVISKGFGESFESRNAMGGNVKRMLKVSAVAFSIFVLRLLHLPKEKM